jgi:hypothetical protein
MASDIDSFPVSTWLADMKAAVDRIFELGTAILDTHRLASDKAADNADRWNLVERIETERTALLCLVEKIREIVQAVVQCRQLMHSDSASQDQILDTIEYCSATIESNLPDIEKALVTIRHVALDLLLWTQRSGKIEGSELPGEYRATYGRLIAYAPIFKPMLAALQDELLLLNKEPRLRPEAQRLISALNRYNAVAESARGFIRSVVEPPLELVFHETDTFISDFQALTSDQLAQVATEVNDCCQLLLYDPMEFRRRVEHVRPQLAEGLDATLVVLTVSDGLKVIFTVDEDPVFEQLTSTLLRVVPEHELAKATDDLTRALYGHLSSD